MNTGAISPTGDTAVLDAAPALTIENLSLQFRGEHGPVRVLDDVTLSVPRGRTLGLVGESGSGKTVTSLAVMGLIDPRIGQITGGSIRHHDPDSGTATDLLGLDPRELRRIRGGKIAMIFQEARRSLDPVFTVGQQIAEAVRAHTGADRKTAWARAVEMLDLVGIPDAARRAHEYPHTFSGGMCQRVMLAAALAPGPSVLIADEPTTALDVTVQAQVLQLLRDLQAEMGLAILFITHDLGVVAETSDRVAVMYAGQVVEEASAEQIFRSPTHPYTEGLIRSLPEATARKARLASIPGNVPPPHLWPQGCHFASRCRYAADECSAGPVPLSTISADRAVRCVRAHELTLAGV